MRVAVVGAGVVGLSTALNILDSLPGAYVTVLADRFGSEVTSSGAGGHFRPNVGHIKGVSKEKLLSWSRVSRDHFYGLAGSSESSTSGVMYMSGYLLCDHPEEGLLEDIVLHFRQLSQEEMEKLKFKHRYCYVYTTTVTEMKRYLAWLTSRITRKGGKLKKRKLSSLNQLTGEYDAVVNCCGLGARELVGDTLIAPVKGQLVKVKAPWINQFYTCESRGVSTYLYPHSDVVNVGGSRVAGDWSEEPDPEVARDIMGRATDLVPALKGAEVVSHWAGLRPTRTPVRLERELVAVESRTPLKVVHNYGHGALGVTLSWGTAVEAAALLRHWTPHVTRAKL